MQYETTSIERTITVSFVHRIFFTRSVFSAQNRLLAEILSPAKALVVIDHEVACAFPALPDQIESYFSSDSCPATVSSPGSISSIYCSSSSDWTQL